MQSHDPAIAGWLARHHQVITRERALRIGLSADQIDGLVRRREWFAPLKGVYVAGCSPPTDHRTLLVAVAAGGSGSAASHLSAAWLLGLAERAPTSPWITVPHDVRRRIDGAQVHRSRTIPTRSVEAVPCTTVGRTLVDCAAVLGPDALAGIVDRALVGRRLAVPTLLGDLASMGRRPGARALRAHLEERGFDGKAAPSVLESHFARRIREAGLPTPVREHVVRLEGRTIALDTAYPQLLLAFEVDGHAYHSNPEQVRRDHRRRSLLARHGWAVHVFTWTDVVRRGDHVVAELRSIYAAAEATAL